MANPKEPQSYGSQGDWVTGDVGEEVNRLEGHPSSQHGDFYESRQNAPRQMPEQGGKISPDQIEENVQPARKADSDGDAPVRNVTMTAAGAKRGGYFRDRDYK